MSPKEMTPKQRWLAVLNGEIPDRVPLDYWGTPEATQKVMAYLGCSSEREMLENLGIDHPISVGPEYIGPPLPQGEDMYGCRFEDIDYGTGVYAECIYHPLAEYDTIAEIEANYTWPTVDWFDYTTIADQLKGREHYPVRGGGSEPFLVYTRLRGQERAYMDLVRNPELVHYGLDQLFGFCTENTQRIYEQIPGQVTFSYVAEDLGSQENLLFSPETIRTFLLPRMARMVDLVHQGGAFAFCHSDGAIRGIIPDLIAIGMDVLNPIQWRCRGMDRAELKQTFGDALVFHGGMDNQHTLVFGDVDQVRKEVLYNIEVLGAGGGYILAPCHNIQATSPPENVVAMYEMAHERGRYA